MDGELSPNKRMTIRDVEVGEAQGYFDPRDGDGENGFDDAVFWLTAEACDISVATLGDMPGSDAAALKERFVEAQFGALVTSAKSGAWDGVERHDGYALFTPTDGATVRIRALLGRDIQRMGDARILTSRIVRVISRTSGLTEREIRGWAAQDLYRIMAALPDFMPAPSR